MKRIRYRGKSLKQDETDQTSFEQVFQSVTSCFRVFPIYLNRFICYETEMGL